MQDEPVISLGHASANKEMLLVPECFNGFPVD
jgi:hypothetical protein